MSDPPGQNVRGSSLSTCISHSLYVKVKNIRLIKKRSRPRRGRDLFQSARPGARGTRPNGQHAPLPFLCDRSCAGVLGVRQPQTVVRAALLALFAGDQPPRCSFAGRARSGRGGRIRARCGREVPDRPPKRYSSELGHAARASPARIAQNRSFVSVRAREDCTKLPILCQFVHRAGECGRASGRQRCTPRAPSPLHQDQSGGAGAGSGASADEGGNEAPRPSSASALICSPPRRSPRSAPKCAPRW